ncbi:MAG: YkgJ family cysteine cluster protein [Sedimentisphaerales bacterium]|nr:YkgJ family cysteine cluster protein [Sedimentisphaerales bacterium]MBN2841993.1 YkgJ family cysteine cluster protein [Sedimentisphaerales bacterium]
MNIEIDNRLSLVQGYSCLNCGHGCRSFMVPVSRKEREKISSRCDWQAQTGTDTLFIDLPLAGFEQGAIAKKADHRCVFLDSDNLCMIHRKYSLSAKPLACQLFPFVLTPFNGNLRVGLRFDCPGVCQGTGAKLSDNLPELNRLARILYPDGINAEQFTSSLPAISKRNHTNAETFDKINNAIIETFLKVGPEFKNKIYWLTIFASHLEKVKFQKVSSEDFTGLMSLLTEGTSREAEKYNTPGKVVSKRARVLFGQILYLLGHSPEVITLGEKTGFWQKLKARLKDSAEIRMTGRVSGPLPILQDNWHSLDLSQIEQDYGPMPPAAVNLLERYILSRLTGLNYCGLNYYGYSMADGLHCLALSISAVCWLARVNAAAACRNALEYQDIEKALILADSNNGYGSALNSGSAGLRLIYLKEYITAIIFKYIPGTQLKAENK